MPQEFIESKWISIHAPRAGGDQDGLFTFNAKKAFQSTPPVRGATRIFTLNRVELQIISIHAPRAGGDGHVAFVVAPLEKFQSTPPVRGATHIAAAWDIDAEISIHAPRAGGDLFRGGAKAA